jgi:hypothetical protein
MDFEKVEFVDERASLSFNGAPMSAGPSPRRAHQGTNHAMSLPDDLSQPPDNSEDLESAERPPMPPEVKIATTIVSIFIGAQVVGQLINPDPSVMFFGGAGVGGLIIAGFVTGHRLAWQWGRLIGLVLGSAWLVISVVLAIQGEQELLPVMLMILFSASIFLMGVLLGLPRSRAFFRLICPACGSKEVKATDFFYNNAKCEKCECRW